MQLRRKKINELQRQIDALKHSLEKSAAPFSEGLYSDFKALFENSMDRASDFIQLIWKEQQKYINASKKEIHYHHMMICYCLSDL